MKHNQLSRRQFIQTSAALGGAALLAQSPLSSLAAAATKRTHADQVTLGKTGVKLSRLGMGTGINSGENLTKLGKEEFIKLVHHAYDRGITYLDCAQRYETFGWIGDAIKGLPREKLFILSKVPGQPEDILATIDQHRKNFNTDYIDTLLIHCMTKERWTDEWKRIMDGFNEAREKKWIRSKGVSCHTIHALRDATASEWTEVHLVRVNPQGLYMDTTKSTWGDKTGIDISPVMQEVKTMHDKGRGVIGMKIFANGDMKNAEDRQKSINYAMGNKDIDAVVIGFETTKQMDEGIEMVNRALAAT